MFCTNCGGEMAADARFCSRCGRSTGMSAGVVPGGGAGSAVSAGMMKRPTVVTILAILDLFGGGLWLLAGVAGMFGVASGQSAGAEDFVILAILVPLGLLAVVAGVGLLQMREYGRMTQFGLSIIGLLGIPVGTIISILVLYYLSRPGVKVLFSGKSPEELSSDEQNAVLELQRSTGAGVAIALVIILLIVAMTGILAAIAIPNLLTAMQRSKQKRTMADMRSIASAWEAYATDNNTYLPVGYERREGGSGERMTVYSNGQLMYLPSVRIDADELERVLSPTYIRTLPRVDGWSREIEFYFDSGGQEYAMRSLGKDGEADRRYEVGPTNVFECDIVYSMGAFVVYPEGAARPSP